MNDDITWLGQDGQRMSCARESYQKIYSEAVRKIKIASDHDLEEKVDKLEDPPKEKKVDEIASGNEEIIKRKEKELEEKQRAAITSLSAQEKDDLLDELRAELDELKKDKEERESKSKSASLEFVASGNTEIIRNGNLEKVGVEPLSNTYTTNVLNPNYSVLKYIPYSSVDKSGDTLLQSLGSSD